MSQRRNRLRVGECRCFIKLYRRFFFFYCREDLIHIVDFTSTDGIAHPYINVCARRA